MVICLFLKKYYRVKVMEFFFLNSFFKKISLTNSGTLENVVFKSPA